MADTLQARIARALSEINNPRLDADVFAADMVRDIAATTDGRVRFTLLLDPNDDATLVRQVREAVERLEGVTDVRVDVKDAESVRRSVSPGMATGRARALPVMDAPRPAPAAAPAGPGGARAPVGGVAAPTPVTYPNLGKIIAVSSGKGGVGKSTVATNLAVALAAEGARVGLMDADIYGPNIPRMMGVSGAPKAYRDEQTGQDRIVPLEAHGVKLISIGSLIERDQPAIWRGPIIMKVITQFVRDVAWGQLDYFIVDMPPGTGDAQLSLVQATRVHAAVIVTTPQQVATGDALRGVRMFERVGVPVLGIVENMSYFECPHCGKPTSLFGSGGGQTLADEVGLPLLGQVPIYPRVAEGGDQGRPIVTADPDSGAAKSLAAIGRRVAELVSRTGA